MKFETGKKIVMIFMFLSAGACIAGLLLGGESADYYVMAAISLMLISMGALFLWCRCPWCGKVIVKDLFRAKVCPSCRRDLITGKKKKGKGGR